MKTSLFNTALIGSMPRGKEILMARRKLSAGLIDNASYEKLIDEKTKEVVRLQEDLDVDIITSGEIDRDNYVSFISEKLGGVSQMSMAEMLDYVDDKREFENILNTLDVPASSIKNAICTGKLEYKGDIVASELQKLKSFTNRPVKITMPGPYLVTRSMWLANVSSNYYDSKEDLGEDVIEIFKKEITKLQEIGVDVIQFDEPVLTEIVFTEGRPRTFMCASLSQRKDPTEELEFATHLIKSVMEGIDKDKSIASMHVCRGNWSKDESILLTGAYTPLIDLFANINADLLSLEFSTPRAGEIKSLLADERLRNKIILGLGVLNPRFDEKEDVDVIYNRAKEALAFIDKENLWLNPDCGFATFSNRPVNEYENIRAKVGAMIKARDRLRAEYE
ncbi:MULTISPECIES: cobalamin-independent methionine synthase II family protein [Anaerococcus]|uniref:5-methyltetrahydropteroyltriglutamate--homocysteine methyltransferase n=1 Tax=Anaerococcus octavius TaxID=54007 RepID=A0A2I1MBQ7_9FIRM|nr:MULTISPECIES: cobalamin-independent methionine synthase II family protein [Anaerococcus]MBS6105202.1 cobalamin-independent methionine synthase II family protein [Anaerococcus sp.]PKZ17573.1 5-methyltetrahydropteroyltriglutamate--homocysteine methyltransferase [Anaerococcus octavius]